MNCVRCSLAIIIGASGLSAVKNPSALVKVAEKVAGSKPGQWAINTVADTAGNLGDRALNGEKITAGDIAFSLATNAAFNGAPIAFNKVKNTKAGQMVGGKLSDLGNAAKGKLGNATSTVKEKVGSTVSNAANRVGSKLSGVKESIGGAFARNKGKVSSATSEVSEGERKLVLEYNLQFFAKKGESKALNAKSEIGKTSYGNPRGEYNTSLDYLKEIECRNGNYYAPQNTIDEIGRIEAKGIDFSLLNKEVMSTRRSTEGGASIVYRYSDENGTKYLIHEVTDNQGYIIHRDFDGVRISSGQIINKIH